MGWVKITDAAVTGAGDANNSQTADCNSSGGDFIIGVGSYLSTAPAPVFSDNKGNTWTPLTEWGNVNASNFYNRLFYCQGSINVGSGHHFNFGDNIQAHFPSVNVMVFSGSLASPLDKESGDDAVGATSLTPGSLTPSENNCLIISGATYNPNNFSSVSQLTIDIASDPVPFRVGGAIAYEIQTTATARNPSWAWSANTCVVSLAVFKAAGGPPPSSSLKRDGKMTGIGANAGPFFQNPLTAPMNAPMKMIKKGRIFVPADYKTLIKKAA